MIINTEKNNVLDGDGIERKNFRIKKEEIKKQLLSKKKKKKLEKILERKNRKFNVSKFNKLISHLNSDIFLISGQI